MSESCSRRAFLKKSALTLGMAAMCHLSGTGRALAAVVPQTENIPERTMLIAYFSHTGNTALVAEQIQALTGGDMHRIRTVEVYPAEHDPCSELAGRQLRAGYRPELASYSIVFLGYPIWWHTMPMACWTFLESYDFTGKTIVPFCTHGGDGFANSPADIRVLCPQATVLEGYHTRNAHAGRMPRDVSDWLRRIGMTA